MGSRRNMERRFKLALDGKGRVVCFDEKGNRVPLGRCFRIGIDDGSGGIKVAIRKSCELGQDFESQIKKRIVEGKGSVWGLVEDQTEEWEEGSYIRKKVAKR
jgi:hypothetical protein